MAAIHGTNSWVTIDSLGVPSGGPYGDPHGFARRGARYGFKLAWDCLWERFFMYTEGRDRKIIPQWPFSKDGGLVPQPITDEHLVVFRELQQKFPDAKTIGEQMKRMQDSEKAKAQAEAKQAYEDMEPDVMRRVDLTMGLVTPKVTGMPLSMSRN